MNSFIPALTWLAIWLTTPFLAIAAMIWLGGRPLPVGWQLSFGISALVMGTGLLLEARRNLHRVARFVLVGSGGTMAVALTLASATAPPHGKELAIAVVTAVLFQAARLYLRFTETGDEVLPGSLREFGRRVFEVDDVQFAVTPDSIDADDGLPAVEVLAANCCDAGRVVTVDLGEGLPRFPRRRAFRARAQAKLALPGGGTGRVRFSLGAQPTGRSFAVVAIRAEGARGRRVRLWRAPPGSTWLGLDGLGFLAWLGLDRWGWGATIPIHAHTTDDRSGTTVVSEGVTYTPSLELLRRASSRWVR